LIGFFKRSFYIKDFVVGFKYLDGLHLVVELQLWPNDEEEPTSITPPLKINDSKT